LQPETTSADMTHDLKRRLRTADMEKNP